MHEANIDFLLSVADRTLNSANLTISNANTFLVFGGVCLAAITIGISIYYNRKNKQAIKESIEKVLVKISQDSSIRNKLVERILENDEILKRIIELDEFKRQLDISVGDMVVVIASYERNKDVEREDDFKNTHSRGDIFEGQDCKDKEILKDIDITIDDEANLEGGENGTK